MSTSVDSHSRPYCRFCGGCGYVVTGVYVYDGGVDSRMECPECRGTGDGEERPYCEKSSRDDKKHAWQFDGDDPYIVCSFCGERRDAL